jgi:hypothetical protein
MKSPGAVPGLSLFDEGEALGRSQQMGATRASRRRGSPDPAFLTQRSLTMGGGSLRKGLAWFGGCLHPCWWLIEALAVLVACHAGLAVAHAMDPSQRRLRLPTEPAPRRGLAFLPRDLMSLTTCRRPCLVHNEKAPDGWSGALIITFA